MKTNTEINIHTDYAVLENSVITLLNEGKNLSVRSGIRTHARKTGLRPERSALDRSAILTSASA